MTTTQSNETTQERLLRLWPGVVALALQWLLRFGVSLVFPDRADISVLGGLGGGLVVLLWWLFLSRARWLERIAVLIVMGLALWGTWQLLDPSIATGAMGMLFAVLVAPVLSLALVVWAAATRRLSTGPRVASMVITIVLVCGMWTLVRTGGFTGNFQNDLRWRWSKTPEERLVSQTANEPTAHPSGAVVKKGAEWPGFRGPNRDGVVHGARIATDWSRSPPVQLWRRPIGPGWSSFAVNGDVFYTQEQRGENEEVACYKMSTGESVWRHRDKVRFWESNAGAGPRATPTLSKARVYTFGATGILNALDAESGAVAWSCNVAADCDAKVPGWGFSSSPLVVGDVVIVAAEGKLAAYDAATGHRRWVGPSRGGSYSSPQQFTIGGITQVLLLHGKGVTSVAPGDGTVLWEHSWPGFVIVQPARVTDSDILISTSGAGGGIGIRRLSITREAVEWKIQERWTSKGLKPYFNDFVVHRSHAFGFDGSVLSCIDLADGARKWKGGRYGNGQLVLLADQDLLLVLSEKGELALVGATADNFKEFGRVPGIDGKTWNHPVLVGNLVLIRNGQEMAAFRLESPGTTKKQEP